MTVGSLMSSAMRLSESPGWTTLAHAGSWTSGGNGMVVVGGFVAAAAAVGASRGAERRVREAAPATKQLQISAARLAFTAVTVLLAAVRAASPRPSLRSPATTPQARAASNRSLAGAHSLARVHNAEPGPQ